MAMLALIDAAAAAGFWKLVSRVLVTNAASRGLLASVGFREVGIYRRHARLDGTWRDVVNRPWKSQIDFCASGKCSVRKPPPLVLLKKPLKPHILSSLAPMSSRSISQGCNPSTRPGTAPTMPH